jgi:hypothetical protein
VSYIETTGMAQLEPKQTKRFAPAVWQMEDLQAFGRKNVECELVGDGVL